MHDKMLYYNENRPFMFHKVIYEYDMNAASLSLSERYKLLPDETIQHLKLLPKQERVIQTGLIRKKDKEFSRIVDEKLRDVREMFINENKISEDDILSLHSDAIIFTSTRKIKTNIDGINFKQSFQGDGYIRFKRLEMFYTNQNGGYIEYKGAPKELIQTHTLGINRYLIKIFKYIDDFEDEQLFRYMTTFQQRYLQDQLQEHFYVSFGKVGNYKFSNLELFAYIANIVLNEVKLWHR